MPDFSTVEDALFVPMLAGFTPARTFLTFSRIRRSR